MDSDMAAKKALEFFEVLHDELDNKEEFRDGLSYLDLKNDTLLSYMIDLCNIILRKVNGRSIEGHQSVDRTVEYRVILEKLKGLDTRLAYQLNKLISAPDNAEETKIDLDLDLDDDEETTKQNDEDDNESYNDDDDDDSEDNEEDDEQDDSRDDDCSGADDIDAETSMFGNPQEKTPKGIYKPPKSKSVAYLGRKRNFHEIYQDNDEEVVEKSDRNMEEYERTKFEEDNYYRLPDKNKKKENRKFKKDKKFKKKKK